VRWRRTDRVVRAPVAVIVTSAGASSGWRSRRIVSLTLAWERGAPLV